MKNALITTINDQINAVKLVIGNDTSIITKLNKLKEVITMLDDTFDMPVFRYSTSAINKMHTPIVSLAWIRKYKNNSNDKIRIVIIPIITDICNHLAVAVIHFTQDSSGTILLDKVIQDISQTNTVLMNIFDEYTTI